MKTKRPLTHQWVNDKPKTRQRIAKTEFYLLGGFGNPLLFTKTEKSGQTRYYKRLP